MAKLLVTGGAGFIGGNFVHYWLREHPDDRLVVLDALTYAGNLGTIAGAEETGRMRFVHGDITDSAFVARLRGEEGFAPVGPLAAASVVDRSIVEPGTF